MTRRPRWDTVAVAASVTTVAYTYLAFPALLLLRAKVAPRPQQRVDHGEVPFVSVVMAAYNEEDVIARKVLSVLDSTYPGDRFEVVVASDGSADRTVDEVQAITDPRVRCLALGRVGKAAALDAAVAAATGEIVVFTDANSIFTPDTIRAIVAPFADPEVGGVAGDQQYVDEAASTGTGVGERSYWDLDRMIKEAESTAGNVISATGALYALRRELCPAVPVGVTDDFAVSTAVIVAGKRLVFEPTAVVYEPVADDRAAEYSRKVRIMTRGLRGVWLRRTLLDPRRHGFYSVQLLTHKVLRRLMFLPLLLLFVGSLGMARRSRLAALAVAAQTALYGAGVAGLALEERRVGRSKLLSLPAYFVMVNAAAAVAVNNLVRGRRIDRWTTARSTAEQSNG